MNENRKVKSISFDLQDQFEKRLLDHAELAEKGKFSKYIKRLIADDMDSRRTIIVEHEPADDTVDDEITNAMKGFT